MDTPEQNVLREALDLALLLVDQIEWVDALNENGSPPANDDFCREATEYVRHRERRKAVKAVVEKMAKRMRGSALALKLMSPHEVPAACELVASAVKGVIVAGGRDHEWVKSRRLVIKFESLESAWMQDHATPPKLVH